MGNVLFPCGPKKDETVLNLSESCVDRLLREEKESGRKSASQELGIDEDVGEKEWMMRLKCLDDAHSNEYGLTVHCFNKMADEVEGSIDPVRPQVCLGEEIIHCLKKHRCCPIRCKPQMDKYIDCVDALRVNIIKEQVESERKEKRKEDQEIVERFLKNKD